MKRECRSESQRRSSLEEAIADLRSAHRELSITNETLRNECNVLESLVQSGDCDSNGASAAPGGEVDLCGRRIAYVGGRPGTVGRFRALVERLNGRLVYHDGGP